MNITTAFFHWVRVSKYGVFSGPYFPVFGLNTERHGVSLRIQSECAKIQTRKNSVLGHFSGNVHVGISLDIKFCFEKTTLNFGTKFAQNGYFQWNREKMNITIELHIWISLRAKFLLKLIVLIFWTKFAQKGYFRSITEKTEHHNRVLDIRISLGSKFQAKLTILIY